jgi:hypothetical protein
LPSAVRGIDVDESDDDREHEAPAIESVTTVNKIAIR